MVSLTLVALLLLVSYCHALSPIYNRRLCVKSVHATAHTGTVDNGSTNKRGPQLMSEMAENVISENTVAAPTTVHNMRENMNMGAKTVVDIAASKNAKQEDISRILAEQGLSWEDIEHMQNSITSELTTMGSMQSHLETSSEPRDSKLMQASTPVNLPTTSDTVLSAQGNRRLSAPKHLGKTLSTKKLVVSNLDDDNTQEHRPAGLVAARQPNGYSKPSTLSTAAVNHTTLKDMLVYLIENVGYPAMYEATKVNCFGYNPSLKSSLKVLRQENMKWARRKVEDLYASKIA